MPVRGSMSDLIALVQLLIADPSATQFTPQQVQDALDRRRRAVRYELLRAEPTYSSGSAISWLDYYSKYGTWESDVVLQGTGYVTLTPSTSELLVENAHWTFASNQIPPVWATGKVYDVYAACADLCEAWASATVLAFDFSADRQSFSRSQITQALTARAKEFRRKAWIGTASLMRDDVNTQSEGREDLGPVRGQAIYPWGTG